MDISEKILLIYEQLTLNKIDEFKESIQDLFNNLQDFNINSNINLELFVLIKLILSKYASYFEESLITFFKYALNDIGLMIVQEDDIKRVITFSKNNRNFKEGIFIDRKEDLLGPLQRLDNVYKTNDIIHFTERYWTDIRGIKFREVLLPDPNVRYLINPNFMLKNSLLFEREENMKKFYNTLKGDNVNEKTAN